MAVLDVCNLANQNPIFQPATRVISSITQAAQAEITTTLNHQYQPGLIVRIDVNNANGMTQINQRTATILEVTSPTTFTIDINTTSFDAFVIPFDPLFPDLPPPGVQVCCFVVPIGEVNSSLSQATRNILP